MIRKKINNRSSEQINMFAEDILDRYCASIGTFDIDENVEKFLLELGYACAGIFDITQVFSILKVIRKNNWFTEDIISKSSVQKVKVTSSKLTNDHIKEELLELASNKDVSHLQNDKSIIAKYTTKCLTIPELEDEILIGKDFYNIEFKDNGKGIEHKVFERIEPSINFEIDNILIKYKKEILNSIEKEYIRVIIIPRMDFPKK